MTQWPEPVGGSDSLGWPTKLPESLESGNETREVIANGSFLEILRQLELELLLQESRNPLPKDASVASHAFVLGFEALQPDMTSASRSSSVIWTNLLKRCLETLGGSKVDRVVSLSNLVEH
jgi:hypothetical protein